MGHDLNGDIWVVVKINVPFRTQKGTIILTATHILWSVGPAVRRSPAVKALASQSQGQTLRRRCLPRRERSALNKRGPKDLS